MARVRPACAAKCGRKCSKGSRNIRTPRDRGRSPTRPKEIRSGREFGRVLPAAVLLATLAIRLRCRDVLQVPVFTSGSVRSSRVTSLDSLLFALPFSRDKLSCVRVHGTDDLICSRHSRRPHTLGVEYFRAIKTPRSRSGSSASLTCTSSVRRTSSSSHGRSALRNARCVSQTEKESK